VKTAAITFEQARSMVFSARYLVVRRHVFFTADLYALTIMDAPGLATFGVDKGARLHVDPVTAAAWGVEGIATVLVHEIGHINRDHFGRLEVIRPFVEMQWRKNATALAYAYGILSPLELWNWAGDLEINDDVVRAGWKWPLGVEPLTPSLFGFPERLTAEKYLNLIVEAAKEEKVPKGFAAAINALARSIPGAGGRCGGIAGNPFPDEDDKDSPRQKSPAQKEVVRRKVAQQIADYAKAKGRGSVPGGWLVWADQKLEPPKIDWKRRLPALMRHGVAEMSGSTDYSYRRRSRRAESLAAEWGGYAPCLPSLASPRVRCAAAIDTSGSMGKAELKRAASELLGIVKGIGAPVEAFAVDAKV
jgi:predicted metal-dependent peptidase